MHLIFPVSTILLSASQQESTYQSSQRDLGLHQCLLKLQISCKKAEKLLNSPNSACDAPGMVDTKCVASDLGGKPYIVTKSKKGLVSCDDVCIGCKSESLWSHPCRSRQHELLGRFYMDIYQVQTATQFHISDHSQCSKRCWQQTSQIKV